MFLFIRYWEDNMNNKNLVIDGGKPVRLNDFKSKSYITDEMKSRIMKVIEGGNLSCFIGSPIPGTKDIIALESYEVGKLTNSVSFLGGASVRQFEALWSDIHKCKFSISVNSATSALITALMALNVEPGSEVVCSPFSFTASATAIVAANAIPVFADIDPETFCLSSESVESALTESTKAIMPIHWNGNAGDLSSILLIAKSNDLSVIEEAAQAPGELYNGKYLGTHGDIGVFSFNQPKNIMTGEGGMIVTDNKEIAIKCRLIRNHGEAIVDDSYTNEMAMNIVGYNFRLVELLAELGTAQTEQLEYLNKIRRENYMYLVDKLAQIVDEYIIPQKITHIDSYYPYTAGFRWLSNKSGIHRDLIANILRTEGIPVASGISRLMSDNPLFQRQLAYGRNGCPFSCHLYKGRGTYSIPELPNAKRLQNEEYLGFFQIGWPNTKDDMDDIIKAFEKILHNKQRLKQESKNLSKNEFISGR